MDGLFDFSVEERWQQLCSCYEQPEEDILQKLIQYVRPTESERISIELKATELVRLVRSDKKALQLIDKLLMEYSLNSQEGVLLMSLAETLLRIPDHHTADALIKDKLTIANWRSHLSKSNPLFVNIATWGLLIAERLLFIKSDNNSKLFDERNAEPILKRLVARLSAPVVRLAIMQSMKIMGYQFVLGRTLDEAFNNAKQYKKQGYSYSFDMLGEAALTKEDALRYFKDYHSALEQLAIFKNGSTSGLSNKLAEDSLSIKLSALFPRYEVSQKNRVLTDMFDKILELVLYAKKYDIAITIDAEEMDRLELSLELFKQLYQHDQVKGWGRLGLVVQSYSKYAFSALTWLACLAKAQGDLIPIRLVKGAYWDSEIKLAQQKGLKNYPVFTRKESTDTVYLACARFLLSDEINGLLYPQFATHNAFSISAINNMATQQHFEFQRLHGMGDALYRHTKHLIKRDGKDINVRIYAPVGSYKELLPYLVRRLLENGANSSFVHKLVDKNYSISKLIEHPVDLLLSHKTLFNPQIVKPINIFGHQRKNSLGVNINISTQRNGLKNDLKPFMFPEYQWHSQSIFYQEQRSLLKQKINERKITTTPYDRKEQTGTVVFAKELQMERGLKTAADFYKQWQETPIKVRAKYILKFADQLEQNSAELIALCHREAGKTINDSIDEIREAIDFCRYYSSQVLNAKADLFAGHSGRGVYLCISPWNFPLAIFTGQISAALICGNSVIAKPAEQTSHIAYRAIELLLETGIPKQAIQLILGDAKVGSFLTKSLQVDGVAFTGSTYTAINIQKSLSHRVFQDGPKYTPILAETGGQNVMIVDSSALLEQVIRDVIRSAFISAGQRCSSLRVLYVQEDIAESLIELLKGAMAELQCGLPYLHSTDIGPVIDSEAQKKLLLHIEEMKKEGMLIYQSQVDEQLADNGYFIPATAFEIEHINQLAEENFGPILHLIRYKTKDLDRILNDINQTGFGLTLGIHSRNQQFYQFIEQKIHVGNTYINRDQVGAVVGVQPFGGHGLSGTGPKAGGPLYLYGYLRLLPSQKSSLVDHDTMLEEPLHKECKDLDQSKDAQAIQFSQPLSEQHWQGRSISWRNEQLAVVFKSLDLSSMNISIPELLAMLLDVKTQAEQLFCYKQNLIGITGEDNFYYLKGRGLFIIASDGYAKPSTVIQQIIKALICGNSIQLILPERYHLLVNALRTHLDLLGYSTIIEYSSEQWRDICQYNSLWDASGVVFIGKKEHHNDIYRHVSSISKSLKQLILIDEESAFEEALLPQSLIPFIVERVKTVNLTAIGGNTALLKLGAG